MMSDFLSLPKNISFDIYIETWVKFNFIQLFMNTIFYVLATVTITIVTASMAGYKLSRTKTRYSAAIFMVFILPIMVPIQSYMITVTQLAKKLNLTGNRFGIVVICTGLCLPLAVFLYHGFIKSIPIQLDESASVDGASSFRTFFSIIFPLLTPMTVTIAVIDSIAVWNDFIVQLLFTGGKKQLFNIQNALFAQFSSTTSDWEHALPGIVISLIPIVVFFIFMQKNIISGITAGAIKG
jgi:raffinose/stachyose/melibiose transport system permease protein